VAQLQPSQTVSLLYSNSEKALTLGDDPNNQQQIIEMSFNTANRLPAEAIIQEAVLFVVIDNPEQYDRLRQELGNVYVTEGTVPSQEQLGGLTFGSLDEIEGFEQMSLVDNTVNVLKTKLPALNRGLSSIVTVRLFFELGSDLDGQEDLLRIWSKFDQQASLKEENPPTLIIVYSLPGNSP
jgi:hypothetical protein